MTLVEPAHCHLLENTRSVYIAHVGEMHYVSTCSAMQYVYI